MTGIQNIDNVKAQQRMMRGDFDHAIQLSRTAIDDYSNVVA